MRKRSVSISAEGHVSLLEANLIILGSLVIALGTALLHI